MMPATVPVTGSESVTATVTVTETQSGSVDGSESVGLSVALSVCGPLANMTVPASVGGMPGALLNASGRGPPSPIPSRRLLPNRISPSAIGWHMLPLGPGGTSWLCCFSEAVLLPSSGSKEKGERKGSSKSEVPSHAAQQRRMINDS